MTLQEWKKLDHNNKIYEIFKDLDEMEENSTDETRLVFCFRKDEEFQKYLTLCQEINDKIENVVSANYHYGIINECDKFDKEKEEQLRDQLNNYITNNEIDKLIEIINKLPDWAVYPKYRL